GESRRRRRLSDAPPSAAAGVTGGAGASEPAATVSPVAVTVSDALQRLDLRELAVDPFEFLAQPLDVAGDGAVVDVEMLAIGGIHQLVAALDVAGPGRQRLQDEKLGDGELDVLAFPGAEMARRVEQQLAALDHRLAVIGALAARQLAAAQEGADPLDQE